MIALAAVIPVFNEQANLAALAAEWLPALRESRPGRGV